MKFIVTLLLACIVFLACNSTLPVTANPDHSAYTSGTAGSAKVSDGPLHEGPKKGADSSRVILDSTQRH